MILIHINTQKLEKNDYVFCRVTAKGKKQFKRNSIYERVKKDVNEPMVPEVKTTTSTNSKTKDKNSIPQTSEESGSNQDFENLQKEIYGEPNRSP